MESNIQQDPVDFSGISTERLEDLLLASDPEVETIRLSRRRVVSRDAVVAELERREEPEVPTQEKTDE